jgi:hypothetical protein
MGQNHVYAGRKTICFNSIINSFFRFFVHFNSQFNLFLNFKILFVFIFLFFPLKLKSENYKKIVNYDLSVKAGNLRFIADSNCFYLTFIISNLGTKPASGYEFLLYNDTNLDSLISGNDNLIFEEFISDTLKSKDSLIKIIKWQNGVPGYQRLICKVNFSLDTKTTNNLEIINIFLPYPKNTLVINEIMFDPLPNQSEYIELYNNSSYKINLFNWVIADQFTQSGTRNEIKFNRNIFLNPFQYITISADSCLKNFFSYLNDTSYGYFSINKSSLNLNNDFDDVVLLDFNKNTIDSVSYSSSWHNPELDDTKGISLERINFNLNSNYRNNWNSCTEKRGGTPSMKNSIMYQSLKENNTTPIIIEPNPFSPDMDGFEDFTIIKYKLDLKFSKIRVRIFDSKGRFIRTLVNNEYSSDKGEIIWDGLDDMKHRVKIGIYIILLEALDNSNGIVDVKKAPVVVATKL